MNTVAIAGVGLIGGSFALALRQAGFTGTILGVSSPRTIEEALRRGVIDEGVTLEEAARRSDLIYLAQPVNRILELIAQLRDLVRPSTLVTDAGSTKHSIMQAARQHLEGALFLGGHPMAGKESRGVAAAEAELFRGRPYILTPSQAQDLDDPRVREFEQWLHRIGARVVILDAATHDALVAYLSHLPQLISTVLARTLARRLDWQQARDVAGTGLLDMTRLALSPFDLWDSIFATNRRALGDALEAFEEELRQARERLQSGTLREVFDEAAAFAAQLRKPDA